MIDKDQAQHMTDVAGECNRLNEGIATTRVWSHREHERRRPIHAAVYGSSAGPDRRQRPQVRNYRGGWCSPRGNREASAVATGSRTTALSSSIQQQQAAGHRSEAVTARDELNQEFERADKMDPDTQTSDTTREGAETRDTDGKQGPAAMRRSG